MGKYMCVYIHIAFPGLRGDTNAHSLLQLQEKGRQIADNPKTKVRLQIHLIRSPTLINWPTSVQPNPKPYAPFSNMAKIHHPDGPLLHEVPTLCFLADTQNSHLYPQIRLLYPNTTSQFLARGLRTRRNYSIPHVVPRAQLRSLLIRRF